MTPLQRLGIALIVASALGAIAVQLAAHGLVRGYIPIQQQGEVAIGPATVNFSFGMEAFEIDWRYVVPLIVCSAFGYALSLRNSEKPINREGP